MAQLLLHCSESFAFWLFVALITDYDLQEIYGLQLRGLFMHSAVIELLVQANLPELNTRMSTFNLRASIYASEWVFGLFASVIPCEHMGDFFDNFFQHRWVFFYQLVLTLLKRHEHEIWNEEDMYGLLRSIKTSGAEPIKDTDSQRAPVKSNSSEHGQQAQDRRIDIDDSLVVIGQGDIDGQELDEQRSE